MRRAFLIILLLLLVRIPAFSLTGHSRISVLTAEPGNELYTIFGHSAIRITDESLNIDRIYNFGTFDFSSPFFYIKFLKGNLDYFLSITDYTSFIYYSGLEHRKIYELVLELTFAEKLNIFNKLERCYDSEDRYYTYDFFYDNCATRVRDVISDSENAVAKYDTSMFCCKTFRQLLKPYISKNYWIDLGVNIALGNEADKVARSWDFMFLPDYIQGTIQNSGISRNTVLLLDASVKSSNTRVGSLLLLWLLICVIIVFSIFKKSRRVTFFSLNLIIGLVGLVLLLLSLMSDNPAFKNNLNILWTLPALIVIVIPLRRLRSTVEILYLIVLVLLLVFRDLIHPGFSTSFLPWILLLIGVYIIDLHRTKFKWQNEILFRYNK